MAKIQSNIKALLYPGQWKKIHQHSRHQSAKAPAYQLLYRHFVVRPTEVLISNSKELRGQQGMINNNFNTVCFVVSSCSSYGLWKMRYKGICNAAVIGAYSRVMRFIKLLKQLYSIYQTLLKQLYSILYVLRSLISKIQQ